MPDHTAAAAQLLEWDSLSQQQRQQPSAGSGQQDSPNSSPAQEAESQPALPAVRRVLQLSPERPRSASPSLIRRASSGALCWGADLAAQPLWAEAQSPADEGTPLQISPADGLDAAAARAASIHQQEDYAQLQIVQRQHSRGRQMASHARSGTSMIDVGALGSAAGGRHRRTASALVYSGASSPRRAPLPAPTISVDSFYSAAGAEPDLAGGGASGHWAGVDWSEAVQQQQVTQPEEATLEHERAQLALLRRQLEAREASLAQRETLVAARAWQLQTQQPPGDLPEPAAHTLHVPEELQHDAHILEQESPWCEHQALCSKIPSLRTLVWCSAAHGPDERCAKSWLPCHL